MFNVILAIDKNGGIGFENKLPWKCKEDLKKFKKLTNGNILIMGRKTVEHLPYLKNRRIIGISREPRKRIFKYPFFVPSKDEGRYLKIHPTERTWGFLEKPPYENDLGEYNNVIMTKSISQAIKVARRNKEPKDIFISGGASIYNEIFQKWRHKINKVYLSRIKGEFKTDTRINFNYHKWIVTRKEKFDEFSFYELTSATDGETKYLELLDEVFYKGTSRIGRNGLTRSLFGKTLEFDLSREFPLLTTKKMFFRGIVEELLFFIRGETDSKILSRKKINIWKGNTQRSFLDSLNMKNRPEGIMGPMYGYQWRHFNKEYDEKSGKPLESRLKNEGTKSSGNGPKENKGIDQLNKIIQDIKTNPYSRRHLLTDFNPLQAHQGVLYPCHSIIIQFYVDEGYLDMFCYNRSSDLFHGLPFNIASSALFLELISRVTNLKSRKLIISLGDCHIYNSHNQVVSKQLKRIPFTGPKLKIIGPKIETLKDIENLKFNNFILENYNYYPILKTKMVE